MAIIRTGSLVGGISGTVGSLVFVAGSQSAFVRPRPVARHRSSPFLATAKSRMHNLRLHWATLTSLEQNLWRTAAALVHATNQLGLSSPLSGFQYFIQINLRLRTTGLSILDTPSVAAAPRPSPNLGANFSVAGDYDITGVPPVGLPTQTHFLYGWPFSSDHTTRDVARLVFLKTVFNPDNTENVRPQWVAHFGEIAIGQHFAVGSAARLGTGHLGLTLDARAFAVA
ncbi:MAG: hypothetical protein V3S54_09255 [Woeseiaceae bacterium]